jgi:class 3 adenylate cyclase/predicted negative regulator of RcsB-dependent stress response
VSAPPSPDLLEGGRKAVERRAWPEAYEALTAANATEDLGPEDLELLAKAAWWVGHQNEAIEARERAYAQYIERGDRVRAAFVALTLRRANVAKLAGSVAQGWVIRAEKLLADEPESASHGYLALAHGATPWGAGDLDAALAHMRRGLEIGERLGDVDLRAWSTMYVGMVLVEQGRVDEGWTLMEEVSAAAVGGELGAYTTGGVFCNVISMSRDLADYRRATEWGEAAKRWCERQAINGFPGICRVHRAEVMRLLGSWGEADEELRRATEELFEFSPAHAGEAFHELGEVRLRMGDLVGAEEAFRQAQELGADPQPGRALLLLRQGKTEAAAASLRRSLEDVERKRLLRARLLPTQAEIAWRRGDASVALEAATELDTIAADFGTDAIRAGAEWAHGLAELTDGQPGASRRLRRARQLWQSIDAPYEAARASRLLAEALAAEGDHEGAAIELETARSLFARLGAEPDTREAEARAAALVSSTAGPRSVAARRTFVFTDITGSTALLEAIGDEAWTDLRRWHDEELRRCFTEHGGEEVDHTGDGFFVAFEDPASAVACAREIQRRLAQHRREHGFAPQVRIGVHAAAASQSGRTYTGMGVHAAARIGGLAEGGEILASATTVEPLAGVAVGERRMVPLKGITEPVEVVSVAWR